MNGHMLHKLFDESKKLMIDFVTFKLHRVEVTWNHSFNIHLHKATKSPIINMRRKKERKKIDVATPTLGTSL